MTHYCGICAAPLETRECARCGTDSKATPSVTDLRLARNGPITLRTAGSAALTGVAGIALFVFPYAGWLVAAASLALLVVFFRRRRV